MIPRFSNPHFITRAIESVARAELFDAQNDAESDVEELELQKKLDELIQANLDADTGRAKKRRKLNSTVVETEEAPETAVLFRLLSTLHTISLLPPPPPPPVTREPEWEDTEAAAETRREWAAIVAVDAAWVVREGARLPPPFRVGRVEHVRAKLGSPPPMMLANCLQSPRKTRPPVPRWQIQHYPYSPAPILPSPVVAGDIPSIDVEIVRETPRKTRKRRRGRTEERIRPQATFWWPPAGCEGKSLGYGMGY
ncbi:hypothetical protein C8F04DRAFT_1137566 [Mycena alexandri]|uniref:Uncharacterized protein n=1 Tax=Mycena alexandri TaxID=1745969 RepID=A0AAD6S8L8_9AGAR|nr:hypothetical protein C8F04DRAFT_1137566 [Mycena alexandri]